MHSDLIVRRILHLQEDEPAQEAGGGSCGRLETREAQRLRPQTVGMSTGETVTAAFGHAVSCHSSQGVPSGKILPQKNKQIMGLEKWSSG